MKALAIEQLKMHAGSFQVDVANLEIGENEYFVLMGMTGSGKSLLLKAVCGLARIESGKIWIQGRDVSELAPRFRTIGYVPQEGGLFPHLNVLQNIVFPLSAKGKQRQAAMQKASGMIDSLHISNLLDRSIRNLSGGERQKVALARAMTQQPEILVLDEPVSALDEPTRRDICRELRRVQKEFGVATLHVCHSRDEAELVADRVGIMYKGTLLETGTLDDLTHRTKHEAVQRLLNWN